MRVGIYRMFGALAKLVVFLVCLVCAFTFIGLMIEIEDEHDKQHAQCKRQAASYYEASRCR